MEVDTPPDGRAVMSVTRPTRARREAARARQVAAPRSPRSSALSKPYCGPSALQCLLAGAKMSADVVDNDLFLRQLLDWATLPKLESVVERYRKPPLPFPLRSCAGRKTLFLDIDETLVSAEIDPPQDVAYSYRFVIPVCDKEVGIWKRPGVDELLEFVGQHFEVVAFTSAVKEYADEVLNRLDPQHRIRHRLYRDSCVEIAKDVFMKDLTNFRRDMGKVCLVDNSPLVFGYQVENGIPIESYCGGDKDQELFKLRAFLEELLGVEDVRVAIKNRFRLEHAAELLQISLGLIPP